MPPNLVPSLMVSGSSAAGLAAARAIGAIPVKCPQETADMADKSSVRLGISRDHAPDDAWRVASTPEDRKGRSPTSSRSKSPDSSWHHQLFRPSPGGGRRRQSHTGLGPFQKYRTLSLRRGSYDRVVSALGARSDRIRVASDPLLALRHKIESSIVATRRGFVVRWMWSRAGCNWSLRAAHPLVQLVLVGVRRSLQQRRARVAGGPPAARRCRDRVRGHARWIPALGRQPRSCTSTSRPVAWPLEQAHA
jgi:hypothetical protein